LFQAKIVQSMRGFASDNKQGDGNLKSYTGDDSG
jgi:hypothetical protein